MSAAPMIRIAGLSKQFPSRRAGGAALQVLRDINLEIADGEFVCILGASGCGKSTLLNILAGLDRTHGGEVAIDGHAAGATRTLRVGYLFQEDRLLPWRTAEQNIDFALTAARVPPAEWAGRKDRYLGMVGLDGFRGYFPHQMSGGMRQRLALARALAIEPQVLLMDEPFSGLDELTARKMRADILRIWAEARKTIVFVTHNSFEASFLADRIVIMAAGRIHETIAVPLPRPRDHDDDALFALNRVVVRRFIEISGGEAADALPQAGA
jgi:ABC-type nitrate/sulfonate/bicarbonate transport system ATPase subunit